VVYRSGIDKHHYKGIIYKSCLTYEHLKGLNGYVAKDVRWHYNFPRYYTKAYLTANICIDSKRVAVVQIAPVLDSSPRIVYYDNCYMNLVAACKRQVIVVPDPSPVMLDRINNYMQQVILPELKELLTDFHYSFEVWYNHLTRDKQLEIDRIETDKITHRDCSIFCKGEKQQITGSEPPKNRCISALCSCHKYVMGPIVYALEQYAKKFKGYCGGKNWTDLGYIYDTWHHRNFMVVQSDISGMDRSVKMPLKRIIFNQIYELLEPYIHHVPIEVYRYHAYPEYTTMVAQQYLDDQRIDHGFASILGTVFSGSCDTTFMNTMMTAILNRFTVEIILAIHVDDYDLTCKGDDSTVALPDVIAPARIHNAYKQVYYFSSLTKYKYTPYYVRHGCGMTLKYLSISYDITDVDFCSTNTFYCGTCKRYRLTRKIDRFIELTCWSNAIVSLPYHQRSAYLQNLYLSNLKWMNGLPLWTQINEWYKTNDFTTYNLMGKKRKTLPLNDIDAAWAKSLFGPNNDAELLSKFGKADYYSMVNQTGDVQPCCASFYYDWLQTKLGLNRTAVDLLASQLSTLRTTDTFNSPLLTDALAYYSNYKDMLTTLT
jgi:hypothetical protein